MNLKFLHFSSTAACMALHLKKEMVPLVHAESVELLEMIRMVRMYSTFFFFNWGAFICSYACAKEET